MLTQYNEIRNLSNNSAVSNVSIHRAAMHNHVA